MKINLHVFLFVIIAMLASINDIIIYTINLNYITSLMISVVLLIIINSILIKKRIVRIESGFVKQDLVFIIPVILFSLIMMIQCDYSYDTKNYHIYIQEHYFDDKINFDFFPGRTINSFLFPLGDRMNFIFRNFFGYRFGVILSLYTLIILFYQMKRILKIIIPNMTDKKIIIFSTCPLMLYCVNEFVGTYYIDNFSFVILLELVTIFINQKNILKEKIELYYVFVLLGIATGIKLPNLILGSIILAAIIINNFLKYKESFRKNIHFKDFLIIIILFLFPFIIYAFDNYIQTGSPIYPYYNKIFQSEYFGNLNWSDEEFGIPNILYSLIWPIIIAINPLKGNNSAIIDIMWLIGYISCFCYIIINHKKDKNITYKLSFLAIILSIVWAIFLMGYARYALVIPIIYTIIVVKIINELDKKDAIQYIFLVFLVFILASMYILQLFYSVNKIIYSFKSIYISQELQNDGDVFEIDGVWGCINDNSAMISLIRNKNTPMYNLDSWHYKFSEKTQEMYLEKIKNNKIYTITRETDLEKCVEVIENEGFEIVGFPKNYKNYKIQNSYDIWYILELKYVGK